MALAKGQIRNFRTMLRAAGDRNLALVECTLERRGETVAVICAVNHRDGEFEFVPLARLFNENPYEALMPPIPGDPSPSPVSPPSSSKPGSRRRITRR
jgi:hypothetical protein